MVKKNQQVKNQIQIKLKDKLDHFDVMVVRKKIQVNH